MRPRWPTIQRFRSAPATKACDQHALASLYIFGEHTPGRTNIWEEFTKQRVDAKAGLTLHFAVRSAPA